MRLTLTCTILLFLLGSFLPTFAEAQVTIPIKNSGFESPGRDGLPADWSVIDPPDRQATSVGADPVTRHSGNAALRVMHSRLASVSYASEPVRLEVGKLYRLSGWIKTEDVMLDPTSRYPTGVAATLTMASFPFTNHSATVAGTHEWVRIEELFFATRVDDRVELHLGFNGRCSGTAWFDDFALEEVDDITQYIAPETITWFGPAFRYEDRGWIFVHIEGEPYQRGYQYGCLLAKEIGAFIDKLAIRQNGDNPKAGWNELRNLTDALMLRKYDQEFLEEMKGIADGAAHNGGMFGGRAIDLLDVVTVNSAVDLGQLGGALAKTGTGLTGRSFNAEQEEMNALERLHKCSSFLANGPASRDGQIVFGQLFMWNGYTGVHWNVICDVVPTKGYRLVYETFPGGIHSGADFYINSAGIMIGETTVMQTPFNMNGEPQSSRIRKAAQYASTVDEVVTILSTKNNGLYTNDWLIGDVRNNEIAILLLGTNKARLWRSKNGDFPGGTDGFLWSVNNAKDPEVRKEYVPDPSNAPFDLVFTPWNRDLSFVEYYKKEKGKIDAVSAVRVLATSPINRPHACDGKVTTSEMAKKMMFLAHFGKVTLREKFPDKMSRFLPDLPGATPHLTLGYSVVNPVYVADELKKHKRAVQSPGGPEANVDAVRDLYRFDKKMLWMNTVYPASEGENWFVSGSATYWNMMSALPVDAKAAALSVRDQFADMNCRLLYITTREGTLAPTKATRVYDRYNHYLIPRIRGTYMFHQLRLLLGNETFSRVMQSVHNEFRDKAMTSGAFITAAEKIAKKDLKSFIRQWIDRDDLPDPTIKAHTTKTDSGWTTTLEVAQSGTPYDFCTIVGIENDREIRWALVHVPGAAFTTTFTSPDHPRRLVFNTGNDVPVKRPYYTLANLFDDFQNVKIVYGTARQVEAHHTLALRYQAVIADAFTETLLPVCQDADLADADLKSSDMVLLGVGTDNAMLAGLAGLHGVVVGKNFFRWRGRTYGSAEDGLFAVFPSPQNPAKVVYMFLANSALQLYQMTKRHQPMPQWSIFKGDQSVEKGFDDVGHLQVRFPQ
jgi:hypothetical protein